MKKTNCRSTTREVFLFNHCRELSFLSQVYSVPFTLPWESSTALISLDTFPRRHHFVIMDFFRGKTWKQGPKLGTLSVQEIDLHKFRPLVLSRLLSEPISWAGWRVSHCKIIDSTAPREIDSLTPKSPQQLIAWLLGTDMGKLKI